jgi:hypothetical protein
MAVGTYDQLDVLAAIKSVVTSRCDGNIELERAQALRDWYTLTMREGEDVVDYGRRSVKLCERTHENWRTRVTTPTAKRAIPPIYRWIEQFHLDIPRLQELPQ